MSDNDEIVASEQASVGGGGEQAGKAGKAGKAASRMLTSAQSGSLSGAQVKGRSSDCLHWFFFVEFPVFACLRRKRREKWGSCWSGLLSKYRDPFALCG